VSRRTSDRPARALLGPALGLPRCAALLALALASALAWGPARALAVDTFVSTDGTLGEVVQLTDLDVTIDADLGQAANGNLFHSFGRFDVGTGGSATFVPGQVLVGPFDNVISRITGGPSQIDGRIASQLGEKNFFFLNPAGTIFGAGASLDLPGSFYVSSADVLTFNNSGSDFLTGDGATLDPPLSSEAPLAFGFLVPEPASIQFGEEFGGGAQLAVKEGRTLSAVGGDVVVYGGALTAPGGQVQLVSVASADVFVPFDASQIDVGDYAADAFGTVELTQNAVLDVSSLAPTADFEPQHGTGRIVIRGRRFVMQGGELTALTAIGNTKRGDDTAVDVAVTSEIEIGAYEGSPAEILSRAGSTGGTTGDIRLAGDRVTLTGGARLLSENFQPEAPGADIDVDANELTVDGGASVITRARRNGDAGSISISGPEVEAGTGPDDPTAPPDDRAERIALAGGAQLGTDAGSTTSRLQGLGSGGLIELTTQELEVDGGAEIVSVSRRDSAGRTIDVDAWTVRVGGDGAENFGRIQSEARGKENGASIEIVAAGVPDSDALALEVAGGGQIISLATEDASGTATGGAVHIDAPTVAVTGRGLITSQTLGAGHGGEVFVEAAVQLEVTSEGQITTTVGSEPDPVTDAPGVTDVAGGGGDLTVEAGSVKVTGSDGLFREQIGAITFSKGQAPDEGAGGNLAITADSVELVDGGQIRAVTEGDAQAGDVSVTARESLSITGAANDGDPSGIFATSGSGSETGATGDAGNILVSAKIVEIDAGGEIGASTLGTGAAGNLEIKDAQLVSIRGGPTGARSTVANQGESGPGGNLTITADQIELIDGGEVSATTRGSGDSGDVVLEARTLLVQGESRADIPEASGVFAQTVSGMADAGNAGNIDITATESVRVLDGGKIAVASPRGGGSPGNIVIQGGGSVEVANGGQISAEVVGSIKNALLENASDIRILDADQVIVASEGTITSRTTANGFGGTITITATDVHLSGNAQITAKSEGLGDDAGPAGNISIAATRNLEITGGSSITTTAKNAAGGSIELQAGDLLYVLDSTVETDVIGDRAEEGENAGDIDIPFVDSASAAETAIAGDGATIDVASVTPRFIVLNRSVIRANANNTNAGNVTISGENVLVSSDSVIEATSQTGLDGRVEVNAPDADIASQITPLAANFVDPSDRLLPPCAARTERTGSFVVQHRERIQPPPDAPLSASLVSSAAGAVPSHTLDLEACPASQGSP
jgi:filamentous hemagglutinin family protein